MTEDFVGPWCERYLDEYMVGAHGFNGIVNHPDYLRISRCLRHVVRKRDLPLSVLASHGRVIVNIDPAKLKPEELAVYDKTNQTLIDSMFTEEKPSVYWPLDR